MLRKFFNLFRGKQLDEEMREELDFHRSQTSGSFGNATLIRERMRDASTIVWLETGIQDIFYGFRQLRKSPAFVFVAVLSLALGIGANTAIFTLINAFMLQMLPVKDPARLVLFYDGISTGVHSGTTYQSNEFSYPFYKYLHGHNESFEDLCAFRQGIDRVTLHVSGGTTEEAWERAKVHLVSGNYFQVLGVTAILGRVFNDSDDSLTAPPAAVLSYPFWRDRFQLHRSVLGQTVVLNGTAFTIAGVAAPEFFGERVEPAPDFFLPLSSQPKILVQGSYLGANALDARDVYWLNLMGRLKPSASLKTAQADVTIRLRQHFLEQAGSHPSAQVRRQIENVAIQLKPGGSGISALRFLYSQPLHLLMTVVVVVLLLACANVATLLLARAAKRRPEFLARLALGATRGRLIRQVLTESILLSFLGGVAGLLFAWWSVKGLTLVLKVPSVVKIRPEPIVLAFTFLTCLLTGILFGIFPALKLSRFNLRAEQTAHKIGIGTWRFRLGASQPLIALQIVLSCVLLFGASLLAHSLFALERQEVGFDRENILVLRTDADLAGYEKRELFALYRDIGERMSQIPGVMSAALCRYTPISGTNSSENFSILGYTPRAGLQMDIHSVQVGPQFLETLRIPLVLGRTFTVRDTPSSPPVVIVNQSFVNLYLPNQNPIGLHMEHGAPFRAPGREIVGVVADSRFYDLHEQAPPMAYYPLWQKPTPEADIVLRTAGASAGVADAARRVLRQINSRLPVLEVTTLDQQIEHSLGQQKLLTILCSAFGILALALMSIGIYGTMAYSVAGRTNEIGIRMAIGAQQRDVILLIFRESLVLIGVGLIGGLPLALAESRWLNSFLFGVHSLDPVSVGFTVLLILGLASLAGFLPARRASRIDPMRALRHE